MAPVGRFGLVPNGDALQPIADQVAQPLNRLRFHSEKGAPLRFREREAQDARASFGAIGVTVHVPDDKTNFRRGR